MNLLMVSTGEQTRLGSKEVSAPARLIKIHGEYLVDRMIRIGRQNGVDNVFCILHENESELKEYVSTKNYGIPVHVIQKPDQRPMHQLFVVASSLRNAPYCLIALNTVVREREFSEFMTYSLLQKDADGTLAISRYTDEEKPLCVALDAEDTILKFSDSKDGYNWATRDLCFLSAGIVEEVGYAWETGSSGLRNWLRVLVSRGYKLKGFSFLKILDAAHAPDLLTEEFIAQEDLNE
jgi:NDP-sugar pyrophosphorylase family protein